jgi:hypothetical protein
MRLRPTVNVILLAAGAALGAACGDTLVDSGADDLVALDCQPGTATCLVAAELACVPDTAARCGATCADCTTGTVPEGAVAACVAPAGGGPGVCGFECQGGRLRCGDGCCEATAVAAGLWHTCAITSAGSLVCWGDDEWGQITGEGTQEIHAPTVAGPRGAVWASGVTAVGTGQRHTCAVVGGLVRCVGWNDDGQAPALVPGLTGVVALAAGQRHTCALTSGGAVTCWGFPVQRGGNDGTPRFTPIATGAVRIAAGRDHTCAVTTSGALQCWGSNAAGQLGDGSVIDPLAPVVPLGAGVAHVAGGHSSTCATPTVVARTNNVEDAVRCWGAAPESSWAPFGFDVPQTTPKIPLKDSDSSVIRRVTPQGIAVGRTHVCVLGDDAVTGIRCFGPENASGQLGTSAPPTTEEVPIPNSLGARALAAGDDHTCAIWSDGGVRCWGTNSTGQLGDGTATFPGAGVIVTVSGR